MYPSVPQWPALPEATGKGHLGASVELLLVLIKPGRLHAQESLILTEHLLLLSYSLL